MDIEPDSSDLAGLRKALRPVLLHHLGGRGLRSWDLLGELDRLAPRPQKPG
jgi:DNA repair protein RecO (recombination protein O)